MNEMNKVKVKNTATHCVTQTHFYYGPSARVVATWLGTLAKCQQKAEVATGLTKEYRLSHNESGRPRYEVARIVDDRLDLYSPWDVADQYGDISLWSTDVDDQINLDTCLAAKGLMVVQMESEQGLLLIHSPSK
jgi:hypothetical protein